VPSLCHRTALSNQPRLSQSVRFSPLLLPAISGMPSMYRLSSIPAAWNRVPDCDRNRRHCVGMHSVSASQLPSGPLQKGTPTLHIPTVLHSSSSNLLFYQTSPDPSLHSFGFYFN